MKNKEVVPIWVPPISLEEDRQLLRVREKLSVDHTRVKNRIKASLQINGINYPEVFSEKGSHWSARFIKWLGEIELSEQSAIEAMRSRVRYILFLRGELLTISRQIRTLSRSERYSCKYIKLIRISGIGMITAMTLLTEIGDVGRFKNADHFRAFIGLIPKAYDSGEKERSGKITKRANSHLRYLLTEATWTAIRSDSYYLNIYKNYRRRMKQNVALIRTAGKLANQIYFCLKNESEN
jgi:transposase